MQIYVWEFSWYVTTLTGLVNIDIVKVEMVLIYHVTSRDHMFKGLCYFMAGKLCYFMVLHLAMLVATDPVQVEI